MQDVQDNSLQQSEKKILHSIILVGLLFMLKLWGGLSSKSLALLSDSLHLITDFFALIISFIGLRMSSKPANKKYTFGHFRHSILTALINNMFLIGISIFILYEAAKRYFNPVVVESKTMIVFSILGIIVNLIIYFNLRKDATNMNVKTALLHFIGDGLSDLFVLIGAIVIYYTGLMFIDVLLSAILSLLIMRSAIKMLIECIKIFLEAVPEEIVIEELEDDILAVKSVLAVRDLHVWSLSKEMISLTAIVTTSIDDPQKREDLLHVLQHLLRDEFNIVHSTIQLEMDPCSSCYHSKEDHKEDCLMCIDWDGGNEPITE